MTSEQYLIQSLMWKQCCDETQFRDIINNCIAASETDENGEASSSCANINTFIAKVNPKIRPFRMKIERFPSETDGRMYYALINTVDTDITRLSTLWSSNEIQFFRNLIDAIVESGSITSTEALNVKHNGITLKDAEKLIIKWMTQMWLCDAGNGTVSLGVRCLMEMSVYIRNNYDVKNCFKCKMLCIRGSQCTDDECDVKMHFHCANEEFLVNGKCPKCNSALSSQSRVSKHKKGKNVSDDSDKDDDTDDDTEQSADKSQDSQSRVSKHKKGKNVVSDDSDKDDDTDDDTEQSVDKSQDLRRSKRLKK